MKSAIVIPTLGGGYLAHCLDAVVRLDTPPARTLVVLSGDTAKPVVPSGVELLTPGGRLGFAAAVNTGIEHLGDDVDAVALLNDDAVPDPGWLHSLEASLQRDTALAAVQGTVTDATKTRIDGCGIGLDRFGLALQLNRGRPPLPEPDASRPLLAVSGTAALYRLEALVQSALPGGTVLDPAFGSYYEDLDLGLRLQRLGWKSAWIPSAPTSHVGSATGGGLSWRHPWWLLTNRWRALAGNLTASALAASLPRLLRGELRAVRTLTRQNRRTPIIAAAALAGLPWRIIQSLRRPSPGPRLTSLPEAMS